ncbi:tetratricopeptide repeat protein [Pseudodesulfovibrio sp.]|uniref:tetratricopeptide repeat protein n=1 Tax=unclassified Pseudodesulfovibrio TaxID=2661612 RepID=UPI003B00CA83
MKSAKISLWLLLWALAAGLFLPHPAAALRVNVQRLGDTDKLTFSFDSGSLPKFNVTRNGKRSLVVTLPAGVWNTEAKPSSKDFPGKLVRSVRVGDNSVEIKTRTDGFGFIRIASPDKPQFLLQIYRDPIGARWQPTPAKKPAAPKPVAAPTPTPRPMSSPAAPAREAAQPLADTQAAVPPEGELPPEPGANGDRKPFFSVPYSVRTEVAPPPGQGGGPASASPAPQVAQPVPDMPQPVASAPVSPPDGGVAPSGNNLRFKAVNKTAEEVKFAELAGPEAAGSVAAPPAEGGSGAGQIASGVVTPPGSSVAGQVGGVGVAEPQPVQSSTVAPAPMPVQNAKPQADGVVSGGVTPPPGQSPQAVPQPVTTAEVSGAGQAGGAVVPPPSVVEGAPPPQPTAEEAATVKVGVEPSAETTGDQGEQAAASPPAEEVPAESVATGEKAAAPETGDAPVADNATLAEQAAKQDLKDKIYEAQTLMFNGNLPEAQGIYEEVLKSPYLEDQMREEALYALADIKRQVNKDDLADNFEDISSAYIEAMNANLQSSRVPHALLNLGLLNLKVGNFPEAKAYFKLLQDKYPDDDNIPSISYYWGEYYYRKGDYKKAADQFQYLIQTYPEHELVKQAAYYLADSLDRTGFYDQAFQIVDYIDKRWPDYYMQNPEFLRLAAGVEMRLKKWAAAKNHYFTFYNLNPEAKGSDVVLARLGDIYIHQGEKDAAKQIYEKAAHDYPRSEGGLVAKMRLAEEGIYDDPTLPQMGNVFNRPYNKRPEIVYQEIAKDFPDSALAPIAQLKLAMWYAFNKQYPEALSAAQDLIEKFPDSPLTDRARKLGDAVFALAVPGMVDEGLYGRVVRYWETYDFIGKKDTKVNDQTKLGVAMSYWKVGQPEKALALLKPYLQPKQVPDISDKALGMAVNIYLDGLAWNEISQLVDMAGKNWKLEEKQKRQLEYARAMSLQNLGEEAKALPLWAELAKDVNVDPSLRAYAMYYMAKSAMENQDLRRVFVYSQEALSLLLQTKGDPEKIKDVVLMSIYSTERSGRYEEALKWAKEYDKYVKPDNPEWASTRFKLARIYRKAGAMEEWKQLLTDIIEKKPDSLQATLAKSELETYDLEQKAQQYAPGIQ